MSFGLIPMVESGLILGFSILSNYSRRIEKPRGRSREDVTIPQAHFDMLLRHATTDMQPRVNNDSSLVVGWLVRPAVQQADKGALATYFCKSPKERQWQQLLNRRGSQDAPGDFADHLESLYTARCGRHANPLSAFLLLET